VRGNCTNRVHKHGGCLFLALYQDTVPLSEGKNKEGKWEERKLKKEKRKKKAKTKQKRKDKEKKSEEKNE